MIVMSAADLLRSMDKMKLKGSLAGSQKRAEEEKEKAEREASLIQLKLE